MLSYSANIMKSEQMKAAMKCIEENNNNDNSRNYERTKKSYKEKKTSVVSPQYSSNFKGVLAQVRIKIEKPRITILD